MAAIADWFADDDLIRISAVLLPERTLNVDVDVQPVCAAPLASCLLPLSWLPRSLSVSQWPATASVSVWTE
jgi:hypothetical protein